MTIWICWELPLLNLVRLDILFAWIGQLCQKLWPFEMRCSIHCSISSVSIYYAPESDLRVKSHDHLNFLRASVVQFRASLHMMCLNRTSVEKLWAFKFLESFRCSISSVSIYYAPESHLRVKSHDHLNFSVASVVQFRPSLYMMCLNRTSVEKLWPFEFVESFRCPILCFSIYYSPESDLWGKSYDHLNCSVASIVQFPASQYIMGLNRTSELKVMTIWISWYLPLFNFEHLRYDAPESDLRWKVMTIWISREFPLFNFERLDILCALIGHPSEKLWPFEFLQSFRCSILCFSIYYLPESDLWVKSYDHLTCLVTSIVQFQAPRYIMRLNRTSELKVMSIWISWELPLLNFEYLYIWCAWIGPPLKSYDHLNFSRVSFVHFRASRYIMRLNRTFEWKVMTIWISRELPLFNFEHLDILCAWILHPS